MNQDPVPVHFCRWALTLVLLLILTGCLSKTSETDKTIISDQAVPEASADKLLSPPELLLPLDSALDAFRHKDFKRCAAYIEQGIHMIRSEHQKRNMRPGLEIKESVNRLEYLAREIRRGDMHSGSMVQNIFSKADISTGKFFLLVASGRPAAYTMLDRSLASAQAAFEQGREISEDNIRKYFEALVSGLRVVRNKINTRQVKDTSQIRKEINDIWQQADKLDIKIERSYIRINRSREF